MKKIAVQLIVMYAQSQNSLEKEELVNLVHFIHTPKGQDLVLVKFVELDYK